MSLLRVRLSSLPLVKTMKTKTGLEYTVRALNAVVAMNDDFLMKRLRELTLHPVSGMNELLDLFARKARVSSKIDASFVVASKKATGTPLAWAILNNEPYDGLFFRNGLWGRFNYETETLFEVYVEPKHRQLGIANTLLRAARKISQKPIVVVPWDATSEGFYAKKISNNKVVSIYRP